MPTGLTAKIYDGSDITLRGFALRCATQFGAGYIASDYGEKELPADGVPKLEVESFYQTNLESAIEDLSYWTNLKKDGDELTKAYNKAKKALRECRADYINRVESRWERYMDMKKRIEGWDVNERYENLKSMMLQQIKESMEWDCPDSEKSAVEIYPDLEPMDVWIDKNINNATQRVVHCFERIKAAKKSIDETEDYLAGLYAELDKLEHNG